jgi:glycosyltransferase involved in cell wall biosynthesis
MESTSQPAGRTFSMVIATYYNADSLPFLFVELDTFEKKLLSLGLNLELIFVDDGSGDESFARLVEFRKVRPKTKLVRLARNFGAVAAGKAGMKFVTGDCFMPFPADLQDPLDDVVRMVEQWIAGHKLVLAVRRSRADPLMTRAFAAIFRTIVRFTVKHDYPSGGVGMMLMDKVMLAPMQNSAKNINPNVYAFWLGFDPVIIEYDRLERKHGRSRWTFAKKSQYLIDTITGFSVVPVRIVTCIGLITAMISFLYAFYIVIATISGQIAVSGFATIVTVTSFLGGCTLFMLGVIGEYLWRIFDQVSGRPESVIAEEHL